MIYKVPDVLLNSLRRTTRFLYSKKGTGMPRIAESIRRRVALSGAGNHGSEGIWIDDFCGGLRFCCDLSEHMGSQIFFRGAYSEGQLLLLKRLLTVDSVFVDVGANQGEFTVCAASLIPNGIVHAFEPVSAVRKRLKANVVANGFRNVQIHEFGLANEARDNVPIFGASQRYGDGTENSGLPTLYGSERRAHQLETVRLRRLDDFLSSDAVLVDVIKIDVEGAELFVLKGAEDIIRTSRPCIIFEANEETSQPAGYSVSDMLQWLTERGYRLQLIGANGGLRSLSERGDFGNILAVPAEKSPPELTA